MILWVIGLQVPHYFTALSAFEYSKAFVVVCIMARNRAKQGAVSEFGVLGVPRGTIECIQFCKNGVVRLARNNEPKPKKGRSRAKC